MIKNKKTKKISLEQRVKYFTFFKYRIFNVTFESIKIKMLKISNYKG